MEEAIDIPLYSMRFPLQGHYPFPRTRRVHIVTAQAPPYVVEASSSTRNQPTVQVREFQPSRRDPTNLQNSLQTSKPRSKKFIIFLHIVLPSQRGNSSSMAMSSIEIFVRQRQQQYLIIHRGFPLFARNLLTSLPLRLPLFPDCLLFQ